MKGGHPRRSATAILKKAGFTDDELEQMRQLRERMQQGGGGGFGGGGGGGGGGSVASRRWRWWRRRRRPRVEEVTNRGFQR